MNGFVRAYPPSVPDLDSRTRLLFRDNELLFVRSGGKLRLPDEADGVDDILPDDLLYLGTLDNSAYLAAELSADATVPEGFEFIGLRELYSQVPDSLYIVAGYAVQIIAWDRNNRFCPRCGSATAPREGDWGRVCTHCGRVGYPPVSPAVLILIHDGDRILLGHKPGWGDRYSIFAGFVEPGESLEDCVRREAMEEAGVSLDDLLYSGSQPWPFPHQVMIGFTARYAAGPVKADGDEIDDARWFPYDRLPELPPPLSLSRQLIDAWANSRRRSAAVGLGV